MSVGKYLVRVSTSLQLFLHFSVGSAPSAGMELDIIVEKTCTVKEVRRLKLVFLNVFTDFKL